MLQVAVEFRKLVPSSHVTHSAMVVEPVLAVKPLFGHGSHGVAVLCPLGAKKFVEHVQLADPGEENEPAVQAMQSDAAELPGVSTYVLTGQSVHTSVGVVAN